MKAARFSETLLKMETVRFSETLKMEAARFSETLLSYRNTTQLHNPEVLDMNLHRRKNFKSHMLINVHTIPVAMRLYVTSSNLA
jgi:hypothetical protein